MTKPFVISILVHGGLVGLLLGAPSRVPPPEKKAVSLVAVEVRAVPPPAESAPAIDSEPPGNPKISAAKRNEARRGKGDGRTDEGDRELAGDQKAVPGAGREVAAEPAGAATGVLAAVTGGGSAAFGSAQKDENRGSGHGGGDSGSGATSGPTPDFSDAYVAIRDMIERAARRAYPIRARKLGIEGVVTVRFAVGPDGTAREVVVLSGSGNDLLDEAALSIVLAAGPYPAVPENVQVPIRFSLGG